MNKSNTLTIHDVAKKAKVSMATVSRVLNAPERASDKTRNKILRIINELGYTPNPIARELATKKTVTVLGIMLVDITRESIPHVISGIFKVSAELNYSIKIYPVNKKRNVE